MVKIIFFKGAYERFAETKIDHKSNQEDREKKKAVEEIKRLIVYAQLLFK